MATYGGTSTYKTSGSGGGSVSRKTAYESVYGPGSASGMNFTADMVDPNFYKNNAGNTNPVDRTSAFNTVLNNMGYYGNTGNTGSTSNNSLYLGGVMSAPKDAITPPAATGLNANAYGAIAATRQAGGTQATPQDWVSAGGNLSNYEADSGYGSTRWYNADGSLTPYGQANAPANVRAAATGTTTGYDEQGFLAAAEQARLAGGQVSPAQAAAFGMPMNLYNQVYGETRYWNADGSLTPAGQAAGMQPSPPVNEELNNRLYPEFTGVTPPQQTFLPSGQFTNVGQAPTLNFSPMQAPQFHAYDYMKNIESSPTYQYQVDQGLKDLTKYLSSQGLLESGFQGEQAVNVINKVRAEEAEAARRYAESAAQRATDWQTQQQTTKMQYDVNNARNQLEAQISQAEQSNNFVLAENLRAQKVQLDNMSAQLDAQIANLNAKANYDLANQGITWDMMQWEPEFNRQISNDSFGRVLQTLQLIMGQNPMALLGGGSENLANLIAQSGMLSGGGGGGSGGGGTALPYMPPQPNTSNVQPFSIGGNYNTGINYGSLIGNVLYQMMNPQ